MFYFTLILWCLIFETKLHFTRPKAEKVINRYDSINYLINDMINWHKNLMWQKILYILLRKRKQEIKASIHYKMPPLIVFLAPPTTCSHKTVRTGWTGAGSLRCCLSKIVWYSALFPRCCLNMFNIREKQDLWTSPREEIKKVLKWYFYCYGVYLLLLLWELIPKIEESDASQSIFFIGSCVISKHPHPNGNFSDHFERSGTLMYLNRNWNIM